MKKDNPEHILQSAEHVFRRLAAVEQVRIAPKLDGEAPVVKLPMGEDRAQASKPIFATPYAWKDAATLRRRQWLYGYLLVRKFVSATVAPGAVGKTNLIIAETLAQVSGRNLLGVQPPTKLRVWLWNLEDPQEETERRIQASALHYGLSPDDIGDRLFVDSGRDQPLVIATASRNGGALIVAPVVDSLVAEIIARKIDIIKIDPFVSSHKVPENDNGAQDTIVKEWGTVAERGNCAVHLIHHTRKSGGGNEITAEDARGGKALVDGSRVTRVLNRMTKDEATQAGVENHRLYFRTSNDKANLQPPADASDWFRLVSVNLGNGPIGSPGDSVGVVTAWQWPDALAGITGAHFDRVAAVIRSDRWRENPQAGKWVGKAVAQALDLDPDNKADKAKINGMLKAWRAAGSLIAVEGKDHKRETRTFIEVKED